ncbi:serine/threonine-protein kinase [Streptomyces sp. BR1]|uniref:serine/threonine-protein kinase n=1 Tax=Streptomyces sp. BR1 TaxID=1592323 RepID=UPI00402B5E58
MTTENGALVGARYQLVELIGQGGMGRVWRGRDLALDRDVAVKEVLLPQGLTSEQRDGFLQRVSREARAAARLNHPGIITVHDVVEHEGTPVIVMELVTGTSLAALIAHEGALPVRRVAEMGAAILKALQLAHAAGVIHRDLKPDNVLLMGDRVIITDFGIAHMADATTALTRTGAVIGTPAYMAPEQLEGRAPTPANDLWSLGATLYSAVEGEQAFSGETFSALCIAVATKSPRPAVRAGALEPLLAALMTKDPGRRPSAAQALNALEEVARTGAAAPVPTPTEIVDPAPTPLNPGHPAAVQLPPPPSHAPTVGAWLPPQPVPPGGPGLHFSPTAPAVAPARAAGTASVVGAMAWRFIGCMALLWVVGSTLPWNYLDTVPSRVMPTVLTLTGVISLIHAVPRPRWHPAVAWPIIVVFDLALYFATKELVLPRLFGDGAVDTGFGEAPSQIAANMVLLGTGAWLLWWKVPGSRPS